MRRYFKLFFGAFLPALFFVMLSAVSYAEAATNTSFEQAVPISTDGATCEIDEEYQMLYYSFTPSRSGKYEIYSLGNYDTQITVYDSDEYQIARNFDGDDNNFDLSYSFVSGNTYYLAICFEGSDSSSVGSFSVRVEYRGNSDDEEEEDDLYQDLIKKSNITLSQTTYTYSGTECRPTVKVVSSSGSTVYSYYYSVSYSNNINAGTASVTITNDYNSSDYVVKTFKINPKIIKKMYTTDIAYTGKKVKPQVYFSDGMLYQGRDYTITKSTNLKKIGKHSISIRLKGNYTGAATLKFKIIPKNTKGYKVKKRTSKYVVISWKKVKGNNGYRLQTWNSKKKKYVTLKTTRKTTATIKKDKGGKYASCTIQTCKKIKKKKFYSSGYYVSEFCKPGKPKATIAKGFGEVTVKFKNYGYYQVQFGQDKKFKQNKIYRGYTNSVRYYGLASGAVIYIRAREYGYSNGKIIMGKWSKAKKVKVY